MPTPKKKLTARLAVVRTNTITVGVPPNDLSIDNLVQTSAWEGYIKLENDDGELILEVTDDLGDMLVGSVIRGSQALLDQLTTPKQIREPDAADAE